MVPTFLYSYEYMREMVAQYGNLVMPLPLFSTPTLDALAVISNVCQTALFILSAAMGFLGHKMYLQDIERKINNLRQENLSTEQFIQALSREGGVTPVVPAVLVGLLILAYIGASMAIALLLNLNI